MVDVTGKNSIEILRNAYNLFANYTGTDTIPTYKVQEAFRDTSFLMEKK